jgi:hypothetical protein
LSEYEIEKLILIQLEALMVFSMSAEITSEKTNTPKQDRRSKVDRRKFSYTEYIPERRSKDDRRKLEDEDGTPEIKKNKE